MSPITYIRKEVFDLSQEAFGAIVGASQGTISKWEAGEGAPDAKEMASIRDEAKRRRIRWNDAWFFEVPREAKCA